MNTPRSSFGLEVMNDGRMMVIGGFNSFGVLRSTEIYDPATNTWTPRANMSNIRHAFAHSQLKNGQVIVASGLAELGTAMTSGAELYDPVLNIWTAVSPTLDLREGSDAILLPNGKVLFVTGDDAPYGNYHSSCELFDPVTNTFSFTDSVSNPQFATTTFYYAPRNSVIMISGHSRNGKFTETEEYDIATGKWKVIANSAVPHSCWQQQSVQLPDGRIIAVSGANGETALSSEVEEFNPATNTWRTVCRLPIPRALGTTAHISGDTILVIGGVTVGYQGLNNTTFIDLKTGAVWDGPRLNNARGFHRMAVVRDTSECSISVKVYVFGGYQTYPTSINSVEMIEFTFDREAPKPLVSIPDTVGFASYICESNDTLVTLRNPSCGTMTITGIDYPSFTSGTLGSILPYSLNENDSVAFMIMGSSTTVSEQAGSVTIHYTSGGRSYTKVIPIALSAKQKPPIVTRLDNRIFRGDSLDVPLYLFPLQPITVDGMELILEYNTDLLEPIEPSFGGTLLEGTQYYIQTFTNGISRLTIPSSFLLHQQKPVIHLRFKSFVSDTDCTMLKIRSLYLGNLADPKKECALEAGADSVLLCRSPSCGDDLLRSMLRHQPIRIERAGYNEQTRQIDAAFTIEVSGAISVYTMLGVEIKRVELTSVRSVSLDTKNLKSGVYILRLQTQFGVSTAKVVLVSDIR